MLSSSCAKNDFKSRLMLQKTWGVALPKTYIKCMEISGPFEEKFSSIVQNIDQGTYFTVKYHVLTKLAKGL